MGWATVTHPFHPLLGKRFLILKKRHVAGIEVLSLWDEHSGTVVLPGEWTDQALPSADSGVLEPLPILHGRCLLELQKLIQRIKERIDDEKL